MWPKAVLTAEQDSRLFFSLFTMWPGWREGEEGREEISGKEDMLLHHHLHAVFQPQAQSGWEINNFQQQEAPECLILRIIQYHNSAANNNWEQHGYGLVLFKRHFAIIG